MNLDSPTDVAQHLNGLDIESMYFNHMLEIVEAGTKYSVITGIWFRGHRWEWEVQNNGFNWEAIDLVTK